jgi:hypothetical protein
MLSYQNMYVSFENSLFEALAAGAAVLVDVAIVEILSCENNPDDSINKLTSVVAVLSLRVLARTLPALSGLLS